jgi:hypothetical protein
MRSVRSEPRCAPPGLPTRARTRVTKKRSARGESGATPPVRARAPESVAACSACSSGSAYARARAPASPRSGAFPPTAGGGPPPASDASADSPAARPPLPQRRRGCLSRALGGRSSEDGPARSSPPLSGSRRRIESRAIEARASYGLCAPIPSPFRLSPWRLPPSPCDQSILEPHALEVPAGAACKSTSRVGPARSTFLLPGPRRPSEFRGEAAGGEVDGLCAE